jgi:hypothetical protein
MLVAGGRVSRLRWDGVAGSGADDGGAVAGADVAGPPPAGPPLEGEVLVCARAVPASPSARAEVRSIRIGCCLVCAIGSFGFNMGNAAAVGNVPIIDAAARL